MTKELPDYVTLIRSFDKARIVVQAKEMSAEEFKEFDERRAIKHNALMSSINIINRFLSQKFGVMSEDDLDEYEEKEEKAGRKIAYVKRVKLSKNIICPDYIDISNREDITDWAIDISRSLHEFSF